MHERQPKLSVEDRARSLATFTDQAITADRAGAADAIAKYEAHLQRVIRRAGVPTGMERVEIAQTYGPILEFTGRLLIASSQDNQNVEREIWQTHAGNLVAIYRGNDERGEMTAATVCEPGDHLAVMAAFRWSTYARQMAKKLGWSGRVEID